MEYDFDRLKNKVLNQSLLVVSMLGLAIQVFAYRRAADQSEFTVFWIQTALIILLLFCAFFRHRLSLYFKLSVLITSVSLVLVAGLYAFGFFAAAKIYIALVPVFCAFVVSYRKAIVLLAIYMLVYLTFAFLYSVGILTYDFDTLAYAVSINNWLIETLVILLTSWGIIYFSVIYKEELIRYSEKLDIQHAELVNSEEKFRRLFEDAFEAIALFSGNVVIDCNSKACEYYGYSKEELIGMHYERLMPNFQEDGTAAEAFIYRKMKRLYAGACQRFECLQRRKSGEQFYASISLNLVDLKSHIYVQAVIMDVTERKKNERELIAHRRDLEKLVEMRTDELAIVNEGLRAINLELTEKSRLVKRQNLELIQAMDNLKSAQAKLIQAEKMTSLGTLTGGVAHEINNPLNFIFGGYSGLKSYFETENLPEEETTRFLLDSIRTGVERVTGIVKALNEFSRTGEGVIEPCDLHGIINNCILIMESQWMHRIVARKDFAESLPIISGSSSKLHQLFVSVLQNSTHAIAGKGEIELRTLHDDKFVTVILTDNGEGIKPEHLDKVMDPFFTTKEPGKGTGMGLSICYQIMKEHHGAMEIQSEFQKGTTVVLKFGRAGWYN